MNITDAANADAYSPEQLATQFIASSKSGRRVGFIGLGAMGFGMATHLLSSNFCVIGYDVIPDFEFLIYIALKNWHLFLDVG